MKNFFFCLKILLKFFFLNKIYICKNFFQIMQIFYNCSFLNFSEFFLHFFFANFFFIRIVAFACILSFFIQVKPLKKFFSFKVRFKLILPKIRQLRKKRKWKLSWIYVEINARIALKAPKIRTIKICLQQIFF